MSDRRHSSAHFPGIPSPAKAHPLAEFANIMDNDLRDAFALAYGASLLNGSGRISTQGLWRAILRLHPELAASFPGGALPSPFDENIPSAPLVFTDLPELSPCVADSVEHLRHERRITAADVFFDIARHGTGASVKQLRSSGIGPEQIDEIIRLNGWRVASRGE